MKDCRRYAMMKDCGIIGHNERECGLAIKLRKERPGWTSQYRGWIRAPVKGRWRKKVVRGLSSPTQERSLTVDSGVEGGISDQ